MINHLLEVLHIISATLLLGGMMYCVRLWKLDSNTSQIPVITWCVILPAALFQLLSGFTLISLEQYDLHEFWIMGSAIGFFIVLTSWFSFIYFKKFKTFFLIICALTLLSMIFLMSNKITF